MDRTQLYDYADGRRFIGKTAKEIFTEIERNNVWLDSESVSGTGSSAQQTGELIRQLPGLFHQYHIQSIFDIPCGDFNWFRHVRLDGIRYRGGDIVESVIQRNTARFQQESISFIHFNLLEDEIEPVDLIFSRDCWVHFSFSDVYQALKQILQSGSIYIMTTTFPGQLVNSDIPTGGWRPLNLEVEPFNFPAPEFLLNEKCTEMDGVFHDKSLGLWKIDSLRSILKFKI